MRGDGVNDCGHEGAEDDVAVEVAPLRDGPRHDGGARRGERALQEETSFTFMHIGYSDYHLVKNIGYCDYFDQVPR